jgi:hypothetical protein
MSSPGFVGATSVCWACVEGAYETIKSRKLIVERILSFMFFSYGLGRGRRPRHPISGQELPISFYLMRRENAGKTVKAQLNFRSPG